MSNTLSGHLKLKYGEFDLDVKLDIPLKGITGIFGHSGCGKTTLLRCIAGLEKAESGFLKLGDELWQDNEQKFFKPTYQRRLGYIFQDLRLFPHLSIEQNLQFGIKRSSNQLNPQQYQHVIELLGIGHLLQRKPERLSGGEKQRVAIGRALVMSPQLLLLDEPLAALDNARKRDIMPYLEQLHDELDIPILYVSHSIDEIAILADDLIILEKGHVQAQGPALELLTAVETGLDQLENAQTSIKARVKEIDQTAAVTRLSTEIGDVLVPGCDHHPEQNLRIRIYANSVNLHMSKPEASSLLNIFSAQIINSREHNHQAMDITLDVSGTQLLARISRAAFNQLPLEPQQQVYITLGNIAIH